MGPGKGRKGTGKTATGATPWKLSQALESPLRRKSHGGFGGGSRETCGDRRPVVRPPEDQQGARLLPYTEAEWLACEDPGQMLSHLRTAVAARNRKVRLFLCACCRRLWHLLDGRIAPGLGVSVHVFLTGEQETEEAHLLVHAGLVDAQHD